MKKFAKCAVAVAAVAGVYFGYMGKNGLPVLGNLTMHLPFKPKYDMYDGVDLVLSHVKLP